MRLVLKLESNKDVLQNKENNSKFYIGVHGWIYNKLKNTDFSKIYSDNGFKPFCFSNLFLVKDKCVEEKKIYNLIISSPNEMFVVALLSQINLGERINLGEYSFELKSYKPLSKISFSENCVLENETIINISINENSKVRAITLLSDSEIFRENLAKNLIRKYNQFSGEQLDENFNLWDNILIEQIPETEKAVKINFIKNSDNWFNVIGARYRFRLGKISETQKNILELCYDLGFGERNSFGFGFMNLKNLK